MKKLGLILIVFALMAFTTDGVEKNVTENIGATLKIQKSISEFQQIITQKQFEVQSLETKADKLMQRHESESMKMLEQANLLKMNCLKYEAAIACLQRHLK